MISIYDNSRIEIWGAGYINNCDTRNEKDKNARIVQIECGYSDGYIVEVLDEDKEEK